MGKKKKSKLYRGTVPIYNLTMSYTACKARFAELCGIPVSELAHIGGGCATTEEGITIWYSPQPEEGIDWSILAHEAYHAVDYVASAVGLEPHPQRANEECAYLMSWFMETLEPWVVKELTCQK